MGDATVTALQLPGMVTLRGAPEDLGPLTREVVALDLPDTRRSVADERGRLIWMGPDEWLFVCGHDEAAHVAGRLDAARGDAFVTVADVTDGRAGFDVAGEDARDVLAKLMPVDFAAMAEGEVRRTRLGQVAAMVWREGEAWRVLCARSVAGYVGEALEDAARLPSPGLYRGG